MSARVMNAREVIAVVLIRLPHSNPVTQADAVLAALAEASLAVLPVEPTKAMLDAAFNADAWSQHAETYATIYRAMLAAASEDSADA